jgi:DNA-binding LacI/PurR family transcriptional regulator
MEKPATKKFIAQVCGVDPATVSLALNNHPRVAARTRLRIQAEARRLGYIPNQAARRLAKGRFARNEPMIERVGAVLFGTHLPLRGSYMALLSGVEEEASDKGGMLVFLREMIDHARPRLLELCRAGVVDGLVLFGAVDNAAVQKAQRTGLPFVVLGDYWGSIDVHQATVDYPAMGRLAVRHLFDRGHRRIGFLGASMRFVYQREIRDGVKAELEYLGLPVKEAWFQTREGLPELDLTTPVRRLVARRAKPTALVLGEAGELADQLNVLSQAGVRVPGDISLVSCEDGDVGSVVPGTAYVDVSLSDVGAAAVSLLRNVVAAPDGPFRRVLIPPRMVEVASSEQIRDQQNKNETKGVDA